MPYKDPKQQKDAQHRHYVAHKTKYGESSKAARQRRKDKMSVLKSKPCTDCGISYPPYVMQWDHINDDKVAGVAVLMLTASWQTVLDEVAKCELVCANCHCIRTNTRIDSRHGKSSDTR